MSDGPLTIYLCANDHADGHLARFPANGRCAFCDEQPVPVRVFLESDVRPLWETLRSIPLVAFHHQYRRDSALAAFPVPEDWR